ncbi:hypothetical protein J4558_15330 [Leptolyngbya sp. 15MV]|nr:hypothetical protein J4558_15330 [Leptolyngbya sp. 15MV]
MTLHPLPGPIRRPEELANADDRIRELIFLDLLERGFYIARRGFIALSLPLTEADLDRFVAALEQILLDRAAVLPMVRRDHAGEAGSRVGAAASSARV